MFRDRVHDSGRDCRAAVCVSCDARKVRCSIARSVGRAHRRGGAALRHSRALDTRRHAAESTATAARARSPKGAMGLMQIMPATWSELRSPPRSRPRSLGSRATTSWRARPISAKCTTAMARSGRDARRLQRRSEAAMRRTLRSGRALPAETRRLRREDRADDRRQGACDPHHRRRVGRILVALGHEPATDDFRIRPGRIRSTRAQRARPFIAQALAAAKKAGGGVSRSGRITFRATARASGAASAPASRPTASSPPLARRRHQGPRRAPQRRAAPLAHPSQLSAPRGRDP
jgi:hypothetical protein